MMDMEKRYTSAEVADRYGVAITTVQRWVRTKRLTALNPSGGPYGPYFFTPADLDEFEKRARERSQCC